MFSPKGTIGPVTGRLDERFDSPFSPAQLVDPLRIAPRVGITSLGKAVQRRIETLGQKFLRLVSFAFEPPIAHKTKAEEAPVHHCRGKLHPASAFPLRAAHKLGAARYKL